MKLISHRVNTLSQLKKTKTKYGVEVDIRSQDKELIVHHDPFLRGEKFSNWIKEYRHGTLILNVKEEGLEDSLIDYMKKYKIDDFFFLDQSFPFLIKTIKSGEKRCAVRISEFESIETALTLGGKIDWIWVDCFTKFPLSHDSFKSLKGLGFKMCIVSPELQGFNPSTEIPKYIKLFKQENILPDAICSKRTDIWEQYI
tara:strand:+ start:5351 stop:5947 length:597 start_codon:yes stop_codon:yes gene_type:complete